ncbi:MAG: patatin-like phospholipase family protein [Gammaproteobacteria bacterium]|nr:MAG: patatin-like phospholipase family protein [Gammaproteobacteria bacterium]
MFWFSFRKSEVPPVTGLVLPGGGARNAYQVGVLKAIADILPEDNDKPFPVITGTSSGALNAVLLATSAGQYRQGVERLAGVWENFHVGKVFNADSWTALKSGLSWTLTMATGGLGPKNPDSVLDNQPLRELIESHYRFARIQQYINNGDLRAVGVTTSGYSSGNSICYFQGSKDITPWFRTRRCGIPHEITIDHLMASIAIPIVFPAVRIGTEFHGDGTMRESAPLSPALHLGANRLLIIGVQSETESAPEAEDRNEYPSVGQISGYVLDTLFMDSLNADIERMNRINLTISETKNNQVEVNDTTLRPVEFLLITPSTDLRELVYKHINSAPISVRVLLRGMGALNREGRPLISYLLFESGFCRELIELGYKDGLANKKEILKLLCLENEAA